MSFESLFDVLLISFRPLFDVLLMSSLIRLKHAPKRIGTKLCCGLFRHVQYRVCIFFQDLELYQCPIVNSKKENTKGVMYTAYLKCYLLISMIYTWGGGKLLGKGKRRIRFLLLI